MKSNTMGKQLRQGVTIRDVSPGPKYNVKKDINIGSPSSVFNREAKLKDPKSETPN